MGLFPSKKKEAEDIKRNQGESNSYDTWASSQPSYYSLEDHQPPQQMYQGRPTHNQVDPRVCITEYIAALDRHLDLNRHQVGIFVPYDVLYACHQKAENEAMVIVEDVSQEIKEKMRLDIGKFANRIQDVRAEMDLQLQKAETEFTRAISSKADYSRIVSNLKSVLQGLLHHLPELLKRGTVEDLRRKIDMFNRGAKYIKSYQDFFQQHSHAETPPDEMGKTATEAATKESGLIKGNLSPFLQEFITQCETDVWNTWWKELQVRATQEKVLVQRAHDVALGTYKHSMDTAVNNFVLSMPASQDLHNAMVTSILQNWDLHLQKDSVSYNVWNEARPKLAEALCEQLQTYKDRISLNAMKSQKRSLAVLKHAKQAFDAELDQQVRGQPGVGATWPSETIDKAKNKAMEALEAESVGDPLPWVRFWKGSLQYAMDKRFQLQVVTTNRRASLVSALWGIESNPMKNSSLQHGNSGLKEGWTLTSSGKRKSDIREDRKYTIAHLDPINNNTSQDNPLKSELRILVARVEAIMGTQQMSGPVKKYVEKHIDKAKDLLSSAESSEVQLRIVKDQLLVTEEKIQGNVTDDSGSFV